VEPAARHYPNRHAARFQGGSLGVLQARARFCADEFGQIQMTHSVSAASITPQWAPNAFLRDKNVSNTPTTRTDRKSARSLMKLARLEASSPRSKAPTRRRKPRPARPKWPRTIFFVNLSGRGDKDVQQVAAKVGCKCRNNCIF